MRVGLQIPSFTWPGGPPVLGERLAGIARAADDAGFASLWVMDHFFQIPPVGRVDLDMLEAYTTLGYLAAHTRRVRLGSLVTGVTYRHPGVLVKATTSLDVLSGGRAWLGIGAAWFEREHAGLGVPFPPIVERFERLEETLRIARQMWSEDDGPFEGRHYRLAETLCVPAPLSGASRRGVPILIGGIGERKTLRLVARYADACNLFEGLGTEGLRHKLGVLRRHCEAEGRDFGEIEVTVLGTAHLAPDFERPGDIVRRCRALADLGVHHVLFNLPNVHELAVVGRFGADVIPEVESL